MDAKSEILSLVVSDYYKGPKQDFDPSKPGVIFGSLRKVLTEFNFMLN